MYRELLAGGAAAALTLLAATAGHAQTYTANFKIYDTAEKTTIVSPGGFNGTAYASPQIMTITAPPTPQPLYVFCIDLFHEIGTSATGLTYQASPLLTYNGGSGTSALTPMAANDITRLVDYGDNLIATDASDPTLDVQLAGVQDAIWEVEYAGGAPSGNGFSFTASDSAAATDAANDITNIDTLAGSGVVYAYTPTNGDTQGLAGGGGPGTLPGGSGAPEPASWALMLLGVGLVGGSLRGRRQTTMA